MESLKKYIVIILLFLFTPSFANNKYIIINPNCSQQKIDGFGVSLCWWANMCGNWDEKHIDEIIDWLVNPDGLNYRIFRYNIAGGDDPENRNCTPHHMVKGKGKRAEMEGFKEYPDSPYDWRRDAAQRKILLKIKEKRPDAIFEAFSNSCPWWMTHSGCCSGNLNNTEDNLKPEYYEDFAKYLIDVCRYYKEEHGIEFKSIAPFNEPRWAGWIANGEQEGCNFNIDSQIEFIKILTKVIEDSGLDIKITASDESFGFLFRDDFKAYQNADILKFLGKWNVHTYHADTTDKAYLNWLAKSTELPIWVSETGASGKGIQGNLCLALRLMQDLKYLKSSAWLDWQYMEENNDQWCLITSDDFSQENYSKNKNYYVRSQISSFIKENYSLLTSLNDNTLAALNPSKTELVFVTVNADTIPENYTLDLTMFENFGSINAYITSESKDLSFFNEYQVSNNKICFAIPAESIITFCMSVVCKSTIDSWIQDNASYVISPRENENLVIESNDTTIGLFASSFSDKQKWIIEIDENRCRLKSNDYGYLGIDSMGRISCQNIPFNEAQFFELIPIEDQYYRIVTNEEKNIMAFKFDNSSPMPQIISSETTKESASVHEQWNFFRLDTNLNKDNVELLKSEIANDFLTIDTSKSNEVSISSRLELSECMIRIYNTKGVLMYTNKLTKDNITIPLNRGIYLLSCEYKNKNLSKTFKIK